MVFTSALNAGDRDSVLCPVNHIFPKYTKICKCLINVLLESKHKIRGNQGFFRFVKICKKKNKQNKNKHMYCGTRRKGPQPKMLQVYAGSVKDLLVAVLHRADENQPARNSCPRLPHSVDSRFGLYHVVVVF